MSEQLSLKSGLLAALEAALRGEGEALFPGVVDFPPNHLERPRDASHGDYASTLAMQLAKVVKQSPRQLAERIALLWQQRCSAWLVEASVAGPGFINLRVQPSQLQRVIGQVLAAGEVYGCRLSGVVPGEFGRLPGQDGVVLEGGPNAVMVEFVSANPTGPLHVGHGRQGVLGDVIANLLATQGYQPWREFYYNDAGAQIHNLMLSVKARTLGLTPESPEWPQDGYRGEYIADIAEHYLAQGGVPGDEEAVRVFAVAFLRAEQNRDLEALGVRFDRFYLESSLYSDGLVAQTVVDLRARGVTFEEGGALWLRTTSYGDDKDRVMQKSNGDYTYFVPDIAYHRTKWRRGFARVINVQGSDHHGTVARVRAGLQALQEGVPEGYPEYVLHKMVTVLKGGAEVKISKRAGSYVTLRDLIVWSGAKGGSEAEVVARGRDAVRFFLASRKADTEFVFDVDLALSQGEDNPVYYVQYAHARACALFKNWGGDVAGLMSPVSTVLQERGEIALMSALEDFPLCLERAAVELAPHYLAFYLRDLAAQFHRYYNSTRILVSPSGVKEARLQLVLAVRQVLANGLRLLGVSAPEYL